MASSIVTPLNLDHLSPEEIVETFGNYLANVPERTFGRPSESYDKNLPAPLAALLSSGFTKEEREREKVDEIGNPVAVDVYMGANNDTNTEDYYFSADDYAYFSGELLV